MSQLLGICVSVSLCLCVSLMMIIFSLRHQTVLLPITIAIRRLARSAFSSLFEDLSDHFKSTLSSLFEDLSDHFKSTLFQHLSESDLSQDLVEDPENKVSES
jgi:uncharacterized membrane-anchored protein YhcB (DUF1043 family)